MSESAIHDFGVTAAGSTVGELAEMQKPEAKDLSHYYSDVTKARVPSAMKKFYRYFQIPGIANLAGGLPNANFFPFDTLEAQTAKPQRWRPSGNGSQNVPGDTGAQLSSQAAATSWFSRATTAKKIPPPSATQPSHMEVPHDDDATPDPFKKIDLATALQYGQANGYPPLLSFIRQFTRDHLHPNVPYRGGPEVILTVGSTDGMSKTLELFTNIWVEGRDDPRDRPGILAETYMYPNVLSQAKPRGVQAFPVAMDANGMLPDGPGGLDDVLRNWDESKGRRPHLMYCVSMGHNPTGAVLSLERRKKIYALCSEFDVIIVEDDPYWYLQYPSAAEEEAKSRGLLPSSAEGALPSSSCTPADWKSSGYDFLDSLAPSFLSVDVDGRVVRLDTFSKTVAPGCRAGWITATPEIVERIMRINESGTQGPSGFVQVMLAEVVMGPQHSTSSSSPSSPLSFQGWKMDGWVRWLEGLRGQYERRMQRMCTILEEGSAAIKHSTPRHPRDADWGVVTKTPLYDFAWPRGGMFVWVRLLFESHPLWGQPRPRNPPAVVDGPALSMALMMFLTHRPHLVLLSPGTMFSTTPEIAEREGFAYFRFCFAAAPEDEVDAASRRFVNGVHRFFRIRTVGELEDLLDESEADAAADVSAGELTNLGAYMGC